MSREVVAPLLVAAGAIGLPILIGIANRPSSRSEAPFQEISANQSYDNNSYLPGVGYYHAPYHMWFPLAYNLFEPGRGYYRGGSWYPTKEDDKTQPSSGTSSFAGPRFVPRSQPIASAAEQANKAARAFHSASHATSSSGSRSVIRGGFGSSPHFSSS